MRDINKNEIIIGTDEYKELLLKDKPLNKDITLLEKIKELLFDCIEYEEDWNKKVKINFTSHSNFEEQLLTTIKIIDKEFYKEMIKFICDKKAKQDEEKAKMKKARAIKDIEEE